jgi:hypothetical protein
MDAGNGGRYLLRPRRNDDASAAGPRNTQQGKINRRKNAPRNKSSASTSTGEQTRTEPAAKGVLAETNSKKRDAGDLDEGLEGEREVKRIRSPDPLPLTPKSEERKAPTKRPQSNVNLPAPIPKENIIEPTVSASTQTPALSVDTQRPRELSISITQISNTERSFRSAPATISSFQESQRRLAAEQRLNAQHFLQTPFNYHHRDRVPSSENSDVRTSAFARILDYKSADNNKAQSSERLIVLANVAAADTLSDTRQESGLQNDGDPEGLGILAPSDDIPNVSHGHPEPVQESTEPQLEVHTPLDLQMIIPNLFLGSYEIPISQS